MNEQGIIAEVFKQQGIGGLALLLLVYKFWKDTNDDRKENREIEQKKQSGEYVSFSDVKRIGDEMNVLTEKLSGHLEKEAIEDVERASMATAVQYNEKRIMKLEESTDKIYEILGEIKNHLLRLKK